MKQHLSKWIKKYGVTIWLVTAVALLAISVSFAAYTNFSKVKRVVSAQNDRILFSSNVLYSENIGTEKEKYRHKTVSGSTFTVEVYNYDILNPNIWNNRTITYTLEASLQVPEGKTVTDDVRKQCTVTCGTTTTNFRSENGSYQVSLSGQTLSNSKTSTNSYTFTIPDAARDAIELTVEAIPDENSRSATDHKILAAVIRIGSTTPVENWTGRLLDDMKGKNPADYDGFNYEISGNGKGTVTLTWNSEKLTISPWFVEKVGEKYIVSNEEGKIKFLVGGEGQPTAYQTQFYKASVWDADEEKSNDWSELEKLITVTFTRDGEATSENTGE